MQQARFTVKEGNHALHILVTQGLDLRVRLGIAIAAGSISGFAISMLLNSFWWMAMVPFVALTVLVIVKNRKAELTVSQFEFIATGDLGRRTRRRVVMTADIRALEFQTGAPLPSAREGLHACTDHSNFLVLPYLDWEQTQDVIAAIKRKLPGLAENWR